jgi:hypothetical protein
MTAPTPQVYTDSPTSEAEVLPVLRELFSQHPALTRSGAETLSRALFMLRFLPYRPDVSAVEAALEALEVEGEVLS